MNNRDDVFPPLQPKERPIMSERRCTCLASVTDIPCNCFDPPSARPLPADVEALCERLEDHAAGHALVYGHTGICGEAAAALRSLAGRVEGANRELSDGGGK